MLNKRKLLRGIAQYVLSLSIDRPLLMHIAPTCRCNLNCAYCYQADPKSKDMDFGSFKAVIDNLGKMGLCVVAFTGGEPLLWKPLAKGLSYSSELHLMTQITTNGSLLDKEVIDKLGQAGLDYLIVSVDSDDSVEGSKKTLSDNGNLLDLIEYARNRYKTFISINTVLTKENINGTYRLIEISKNHYIPISIGYISHPPNGSSEWRGKNLEFKMPQDKELVEKVTRRILQYIQDGYPIVEPPEYFKGIKAYLEGEKTWDCVAARAKAIQVNPKGFVYWCSRLNKVSSYKAEEITNRDFPSYIKAREEIINICNTDCYGNCAVNGYFFRKDKYHFLGHVVRCFCDSIPGCPWYLRVWIWTSKLSIGVIRAISKIHTAALDTRSTS